jgi:hypothetical protein
MLSLVGLTAIPCSIAGSFTVTSGLHCLPVAANRRSPSGDDLRNYEVQHLDPARRTEYQQLFVRMDTRSETRNPCHVCRTPVRMWVCRSCFERCKHELINGWIVRTNGAKQAFQRCLRCGNMPTSLPRGATIYDLCLRDNVTSGTPPCARCLSVKGTEIQHWAPEAIFEDSDEWPVSHLCRDCHDLWHKAMRAARGVGLTTRMRAAASPPDAA